MKKQLFFAHSGGPQGKPGQGSYDSAVPFSHVKLYKKMFPGAFLHELTGHNHAFAEVLPLLVEHIRKIHINQQTKVKSKDDTNTGK